MRVAVVTGAARGIGAATVAALAADGWRVLAIDRCSDDPRLPYPMASAADLAAAVAVAVEGAGAAGDARGLEADATDAEAMTSAVAAAAEWGEVEAIVANAGVIAGGVPAWELSSEQQEAVIEVNLLGAMIAARVGVPELLRRPEPRAGRFVAVSSAAAFRGMSGIAAYSAAKAGVAGFVRGLATDLGGTGVTANAVAPGSTRTPILEESARIYGLEDGEDFAAQQPLKRLLDPAEVAVAIAWLVGPQTSALTGATIPVDGGLSL